MALGVWPQPQCFRVHGGSPQWSYLRYGGLLWTDLSLPRLCVQVRRL